MSINLIPYAAENLGIYYSHRVVIAGVTFFVCDKKVSGDGKWHAAIESGTGYDMGAGMASFSAVGNTMKAAINHSLALQRAFVMRALENKA